MPAASISLHLKADIQPDPVTLLLVLTIKSACSLYPLQIHLVPQGVPSLQAQAEGPLVEPFPALGPKKSFPFSGKKCIHFPSH